MCNGVSVLAGATSSNSIRLSAVCPFSILRAADLPGAMFQTFPFPGPTTKPLSISTPPSLAGCLWLSCHAELSHDRLDWSSPVLREVVPLLGSHCRYNGAIRNHPFWVPSIRQPPL